MHRRLHRPGLKRTVHRLRGRNLQGHDGYCRMHHMPCSFQLAERERGPHSLHLQSRLHRRKRRRVRGMRRWKIQEWDRFRRVHQLSSWHVLRHCRRVDSVGVHKLRGWSFL